LKFKSSNNKKIIIKELGSVMKTLGHKVSEAQLKEIMKLIDQNGNGNLICFLCVSFFVCVLYILSLNL